MARSMKKTNLQLLLQVLFEQAVQPKQQGQIGKAYLFREQIMQMVQSELKSMAKGGAITSQEQYVAACEDVLTKIRSDFDLTFSMIERTLKQVPFQAFVSETKRPTAPRVSAETRKTK